MPPTPKSIPTTSFQTSPTHPGPAISRPPSHSELHPLGIFPYSPDASRTGHFPIRRSDVPPSRSRIRHRGIPPPGHNASRNDPPRRDSSRPENRPRPARRSVCSLSNAPPALLPSTLPASTPYPPPRLHKPAPPNPHHKSALAKPTPLNPHCQTTRPPENNKRGRPHRGHPLSHTPPERYSSTNFACTLYCSLMVLKSSGSSAAASSAYPALALRITAILS